VGNLRYPDAARSLLRDVVTGSSFELRASARTLPVTLTALTLHPVGNFSSARSEPEAGWNNVKSFSLPLSSTNSDLRFVVLIGSVTFSHSGFSPLVFSLPSTLQALKVAISSPVPGSPAFEPKSTPCGKTFVSVHVIVSPSPRTSDGPEGRFASGGLYNLDVFSASSRGFTFRVIVCTRPRFCDYGAQHIGSD
jgi:hypothetical protein